MAVGAEVAFGMLREGQGEGEGLFIHVYSFLSILSWLVFSVCKSIWNHNFLTQTLNSMFCDRLNKRNVRVKFIPQFNEVEKHNNEVHCAIQHVTKPAGSVFENRPDVFSMQT